MHYRAISSRVFKREDLKIIKHGHPVGDQRNLGFVELYLFDKLGVSSSSNVLFPSRLLLTL